MIKGTYIFYQDGKEIYRSPNIITKFGKRFITNFIAGNVDFKSKEMAFGIASSSDYALSDGNSRLGFEFYRSPVDFGSINIQPDGEGGFTYSAIYKSLLPQNLAGQIKEVGLYPGIRGSVDIYGSRFLSDFEDNIVWTDLDGNSPDSVLSENGASPKIGSYLSKINTVTSSATVEYLANINSLDLSGYSINDSISLAYHQHDTNLDSISIKFYSSATDYYEAIFDAASSTGYKIVSVDLSDMLNNPVNSPVSNSINKISISATSKSTGAAIVYVDGLRINDEDTFSPDYGMISRSIITGGLSKELGRSVEVEYRLELF